MKIKIRFIPIFLLLIAVSFGILYSSPCTAAEIIKGIVTAMDAGNNQIQVAVKDPKTGISRNLVISVYEYTKAKGEGALNTLDVGNKVIVDIDKGAKGDWKMISIKRWSVPLTPSSSKLTSTRYLKTKTQEKPAGRRGILDYPFAKEQRS